MKKELSINDVVAITTLMGDAFCGEQSPDNIALLAKTAKLVPHGGIYLELGMRVGMSTLAVALANLDIQLFSVDRDLACNDHLTARIERLYKAMPSFMLRGDWKLRERIRFIGKDSIEAAKTWNKPIDFFFADADHTEAGIKADIEVWLPFVKQNGIAAFHDYADDENLLDGYPNKVSKVVNEMIMMNTREWMLYEANYHLAVFRKFKR